MTAATRAARGPIGSALGATRAAAAVLAALLALPAGARNTGTAAAPAVSAASAEPSSSAAPASPAAPVQATRQLTGPAVFAVRPPPAAIEGQEGGDEALAHLAFAVAGLRRCLGRNPVAFETVAADALTLTDGGTRHALRFGVTDDGLAIVLAEPGRGVRVVRGGVGPSALPHLAQQAAWSYWRARRCRQE